MSAVRAETIVEPYVCEDRARGLFRVNRRVFVDPAVLEREGRLYSPPEFEVGLMRPGFFAASVAAAGA